MTKNTLDTLATAVDAIAEAYERLDENGPLAKGGAYAFDVDGNPVWFHDETAYSYSLCGALWEWFRLVYQPQNPNINEIAFGYCNEQLDDFVNNVIHTTFRALADALATGNRPPQDASLAELDTALDAFSNADTTTLADIKTLCENATQTLNNIIRNNF